MKLPKYLCNCKDICNCNSETESAVTIFEMRRERKPELRGLKQLLLAERTRLEDIVKIKQAELENKPEGTLRLSKSKGITQYYHCTDENKLGKYIAKGNEKLIKALAQKSYDEKLLQLAEKRRKQIDRILIDYEDDEIEKIFKKEHVERQRLIQAVEPTWDQKVKMWADEKYHGKGFQEGIPLILTDRGERVRSKTEKIMADYFYRHGIEYKYECPIYLKGMGTVYPDFTFLSRKTGSEVYWEHCGMVDCSEYARNMVQKIETYENNGIFPGERLILTYETEKSVLSTEKIAQMVERYLK